MEFSLTRCFEILERTPTVLRTLLHGLPDDWVMQNEGEKTWSPYDIVGHLIHGERTDWIARARIILSDGPQKTFTPFDRFAMFDESKGKSLSQLLDEFESLRTENLRTLRSLGITPEQFSRTAQHPSLGQVTMRNLLATWTVHDLNHLHQMTRVMAKQYKSEVGPWVQFLGVMHCGESK